MIYGYIRTSRAAVDGLAGMHPQTQVQALAGAGAVPASGPRVRVPRDLQDAPRNLLANWRTGWGPE